MHIHNRQPIFVPREYRAEIEKLSKAALMDIAWDYANQIAGALSDVDTMLALRERIDLVTLYRARARE